MPFCPRFTKIRGILITNACYYQNTIMISTGLANPGEAAHRSPLVFLLCVTLHLVLNALSFRTEASDKTLCSDPGQLWHSPDSWLQGTLSESSDSVFSA